MDTRALSQKLRASSTLIRKKYPSRRIVCSRSQLIRWVLPLPASFSKDDPDRTRRARAAGGGIQARRQCMRRLRVHAVHVEGHRLPDVFFAVDGRDEVQELSAYQSVIINAPRFAADGWARRRSRRRPRGLRATGGRIAAARMCTSGQLSNIQRSRLSCLLTVNVVEQWPQSRQGDPLPRAGAIFVWAARMRSSTWVTVVRLRPPLTGAAATLRQGGLKKGAQVEQGQGLARPRGHRDTLPHLLSARSLTTP